MAIRYRDVAILFTHKLLAGVNLNSLAENLGHDYNNGRKLTEKQVEKVNKHFQKQVLRLEKARKKIEERNKNKKPKKEKKEKKTKGEKKNPPSEKKQPEKKQPEKKNTDGKKKAKTAAKK